MSISRCGLSLDASTATTATMTTSSSADELKSKELLERERQLLAEQRRQAELAAAQAEREKREAAELRRLLEQEREKGPYCIIAHVEQFLNSTIS
jgi:septal ring factor EnvC (AmiA/AmiB activator)